MANTASKGDERQQQKQGACQDDAAVILDGQEEESETVKRDVEKKLHAHSAAKRYKPWATASEDNLSVIEDCNGVQHFHSDGDNEITGKGGKKLGNILSFKKHSGDNSSNNNDKDKDGTNNGRATFKPIRLAVAKARIEDDNNSNNVIEGQSAGQRVKRTTTILPGVDGSSETLASGDEQADSDAESYIEFNRPSPTISMTASRSSVTSLQESELKFRQCLKERFDTTGGSSSAVNDSNLAEAPSKNGYWKNSRHGSKTASIRADGQEPSPSSPASTNSRLPYKPTRSNTMRGYIPGQQENKDYKPRTNSLRPQIPFIGRRRKRKKGKGKKSATEESSSEEEQDDEDLFHEILKQAGLFNKDVPEQMVVEALWQNERGIHLLGTRYGRNALLPGDPRPWTDYNGQLTAYNPSNFPLPTPAWRWHHAEWLVSMIGDVDSEGYTYSTRFSSKYWRGIPEIRFFVRRRLWIRARFRPALKAQNIAQMTHPQIQRLESQGPSNQGAFHPRASVAPTLLMSDYTNDLILVSKLATQLDPQNPFISYYALKAEPSIQVNGADAIPPRIPLKHEVVHANFIRVAKILVRRTYVDRGRLAWWEYWLRVRETPLHVTDISVKDSLFKLSGTISEDTPSGASDTSPGEFNRPDLRDVWDLIEDRLDNLLGLFEYQETRRRFLLLLQELHNTSHPDHHYKDRSSSPDYPREIAAQHAHGGTDEWGANATTRAKNGDGTHAHEEARPRLAFWGGLESRLKSIQITTALSDVQKTTMAESLDDASSSASSS